MSFTAANDPRELWTLLAALGAMAGVLAWRVHREGDDPGQVVSRLSDGSVIGAWKRGVRHRPARGVMPARPAAEAPADAGAMREDLEPGDLHFVRIREARRGETGWLVEGMDSEPEPFRIQWQFDTPDEAILAYRLVQDRILESPRDARGMPVVLLDREFDARWGAGPAAKGPART